MKRKYKVSFVMTLDSADLEMHGLTGEEIDDEKTVKEFVDEEWLANEDWARFSKVKVKKVSK